MAPPRRRRSGAPPAAILFAHLMLPDATEQDHGDSEPPRIYESTMDAITRGTSDGLTKWLRTQFAATRYAGIELELNQGMLARPSQWRGAVAAIEASLAAVVSPPARGAAR